MDTRKTPTSQPGRPQGRCPGAAHEAGPVSQATPLSAPTPWPARDLGLAEARGKHVLLYEHQGVLAGTFSCARCGAMAHQPELIVHAPACAYAVPNPTPSTPSRSPRT